VTSSLSIVASNQKKQKKAEKSKKQKNRKYSFAFNAMDDKAWLMWWWLKKLILFSSLFSFLSFYLC
jgi:hypothetical protein